MVRDEPLMTYPRTVRYLLLLRLIYYFIQISLRQPIGLGLEEKLVSISRRSVVLRSHSTSELKRSVLLCPSNLS